MLNVVCFSHRSPTCDLCDRDACVYCHQCHDMFCVTCSDIHKGTEAFRDHKSEALELVEFCITHHSQAKNLFCHECNNVICNRCAIASHANHRINIISDIAQERRSRIKDLLSKASKPRMDKATIDLIEERYCTTEKKMEEAVTMFQAYIKKVLSLQLFSHQ